MINQYVIKVRIDGHYTERDVNCPPEWRGSGCYDVEHPMFCVTDVEVWAQNAKDAERLAEDYHYDQFDDTVEVDIVQAVGVTLAKVLYDRGEDEVGVIEPVNIEWKYGKEKNA